MGNFQKHFKLAKEKFKATITAYHNSRQEYSNENFPDEINKAMRKIWFAYGDLGYDGINGKRAKAVIDNLKIIIEFFEKRFEMNIYEENT
ncbi:unnamed protein product [marine sediment metagenome]|uniref:Uncharacterized protein n=1 Tax=marine sediment metagenome TaxID=412755 RepID=X1PJ24_9ZZZZ